METHASLGTTGGRQYGSHNKRADSNADYIARRYGDPLEHLARKAVQSVDELAQECGVPRLVAFDFRCAVEKLLARYIEQQPAKPVQLAARGDPTGAGALHLAAAQAIAETMRPTELAAGSEKAPLALTHSAERPPE
jgi:hypothetical protein